MLGSPRFWAQFHLVNVFVWIAFIPITLLTSLKSSIPFLVFVSLLALVYSEMASWQAARAERREDPDDEYGGPAAT